VGNEHVCARQSRERYAGGRRSGAIAHAGERQGFPATRVSYKLNLRGPSINVNTPAPPRCRCTTRPAEPALRRVPDGTGRRRPRAAAKTRGRLSRGMIFFPMPCRRSMRCAGTVDRQRVGIVVLKPLSEAVADGDFIHAVIKGTAVNNDGPRSRVHRASVERQAAVITERARRELPTDTVAMSKRSGTATPLAIPSSSRLRGLRSDSRDARPSARSSQVGHLERVAWPGDQDIADVRHRPGAQV